MSIQWTPKMDAMLGKDVDAVIALKLGVSTASVYHRRLRLGIESCVSRVTESDLDAAILSKRHGISQMARKFQVPQSYVLSRMRSLNVRGRPSQSSAMFRRVDWSLSNSDIAKVLGVSREYVRQKRILLGKVNHAKG